MHNSSPRVFISSTIYDFRDLRSALQFWMEELGYTVLLSENPEFPTAASNGSYDSCIAAIDTCDYFVLLIGSRVGGWYDAESRISITQAEYRHAYSLAVQHKITIASFVREDLWNIREDRNALREFLENDAQISAELTPEDVNAITMHRSKFATDADFIVSFLKEVARTEQMKAAIANAGDFPVGNWIYRFSDFGDIVAALRHTFNASTRMQKVALAANLKLEIEDNLRSLLRMRECDGNVSVK